MLSAVLVLSGKGHILISRSFREDVDTRSISSAFRNKILIDKQADRGPVKTIGSTSFLWIRADGMYFLGVTKKNVNAALVFEFLYKLRRVFMSYFGGKKQILTEEKLKNNFSLVYELIDEVLDFGYPQNCEADVLKSYITMGGLPVTTSDSQMKQIMEGVTGAVNWRPTGINYKRNEVFIDIIENVNMLINNRGKVLNSSVTGKIVMKCFLSGMPECKFGLNDKLMMSSERAPKKLNRRYRPIDIDDITFHQCVKLGKFDSDRTISFVPLDGEFEVMSYRISNNIRPLFRIISPIVRETGQTKVEIQITVKSEFSESYTGRKVVVKIPTPGNTAKCKIRVGGGKAKYKPDQKAIIWTIKKFPGGQKLSLAADVDLAALTRAGVKWDRPPISMEFQVPMLTASGLHVRFLKVVEKKLAYKAIKWVRYQTNASKREDGAGSSGFEVRI